MFNFDMKQLNWDKFFYNYIRGLRVYLLKDDLSTLPQAMVRWKRLVLNTVKNIVRSISINNSEIV